MSFGLYRVLISIRQTLKELVIHHSTFYKWYRRHLEDGVEGLGPKKPKARTFWDEILEEVKEQVVYEALEQTELLLPGNCSRYSHGS
jgi:putative transposase